MAFRWSPTNSLANAGKKERVLRKKKKKGRHNVQKLMQCKDNLDDKRWRIELLSKKRKKDIGVLVRDLGSTK